VRPYLEKSHHKKGLAEWVKVKALSSNPSTSKKKKKEQKTPHPKKTQKKPSLYKYQCCSELLF
jgi:hypothetical protein